MDNCEGVTFATGEICRLTGVYRARCCPAIRIEFDEGEIFPPCWSGGRQHAVVWEYVGSF